MSTLLPHFLKPGDRIRLTATARPVTAHEIAPALRAIEAAGLVPVLDEALFQRVETPVGLLAGNDADRQAALQRALNDTTCRAILFARGGYGTVRLLEGLDWTGLHAHPKWLIGFSDVTAVLLAAYTRSIASVHGPMARWNHPPTETTDFDALLGLLLGQPPALSWQTDGEQEVAPITAPLVAANLALLVASIGTAWEPNLRGCSLLIEETGEYAYRIDRMLLQLRQAGLLDGIAALLVGDCSHSHADEVFTTAMLKAIVQERLAGLAVPIVFGAPVGHKANQPVIVGSQYILGAADGTATLSYAGMNP